MNVVPSPYCTVTWLPETWSREKFLANTVGTLPLGAVTVNRRTLRVLRLL